MIGFLEGRLIKSRPDQVLVGVGGVGYAVHVPLSTFYEIEKVGPAGTVRLFVHTHVREDALARDIPGGLYVGHVKVAEGSAVIEHQEHAPITLREGTYRVRRQRELEPRDATLVSD